MKLFISYRSLDAAKVDILVNRLDSLQGIDGQPYEIWQDKHNIPAGKDWWKSIVQAINDCKIFIFMVSKESAQNPNCRAELSYARKRNRPIIPIVLDKEFRHNHTTGKNDISFWEHIPDELNSLRSQFLWDEGTSLYDEFKKSITNIEQELAEGLWNDRWTPEPPNPDDAIDITQLYDQACDYGYRLAFDNAERLFDKIAKWHKSIFTNDANEWISLLRRYKQLVSVAESVHTQHKLSELWEDYVRLFPKPFIHLNNGLFDPKNFAAQFTPLEGNSQFVSPEKATSSKSHFGQKEEKTVGRIQIKDGVPRRIIPVTELEEAIERARNFKGRHNTDWIPYIHEFDGVEMCLVPAGKFTMGFGDGEKDEKPVHEQIIATPYWIDRYSITNAQYKRAVDTGACEPPLDKRFYDDASYANHPVVYVTWYMAVKYAEWRSTLTKSIIYRLPTECEWEYAARGVENWIYPWGNQFVADNVVYKENSVGQTADVYSKPKAVSWVGAFHLSGNVWNWCSSIYKTYPYQRDNGCEDLNQANVSRVLRGGSWHNIRRYLRTPYRGRSSPISENYYYGFRLARSLNDAGF